MRRTRSVKAFTAALGWRCACVLKRGQSWVRGLDSLDSLNGLEGGVAYQHSRIISP